VATIWPVLLMTTLSTWPAAEPFWLIDEVADGEAKLVRIALAPAAGTTSHVIAFGVAPFAHVAGPGIVMSAAGAVRRRLFSRRHGPPSASSRRRSKAAWPGWASRASARADP